MKYRVPAVFILGMMVFAGAAAGETKKPWKADPARGAQLAERLCASCHLVGDPQNETTIAGIPPLKAIAGLDGMTRRRVTNALMVPHAPMPDIQLTIKEIQDIVAYLEELIGRELEHDDGGAPDAKEKPKYPSPS
jgi:mono/diheme cytochrome c family protein